MNVARLGTEEEAELAAGVAWLAGAAFEGPLRLGRHRVIEDWPLWKAHTLNLRVAWAEKSERERLLLLADVRELRKVACG